MTDPQNRPPTGPHTGSQTGPQSDDPQRGQPNRSDQKFELSPAQVTGSALAAMSGAFLASYLGTAGTIIGAVVGSLIATIGTAAYTWWLRRTSEVVKRTASQVRETGMGSTVVVPLLPSKRRTGSRAPGSEPGSEPGVQDGATSDSDAPSGDESGSGSGDESGSGDGPGDGPGDGDGPNRWAWARNRPWGKVALVGAGIALAVVAGLTVVESVTGKPLSSYTKGGDQTGTSVSHLGRRHSTPSPSPAKPSQSGTSTPTPSPSESPLTPTPLPTPSPTGLSTESATPTPTPSPSVGISETP